MICVFIAMDDFLPCTMGRYILRQIYHFLANGIDKMEV